MTQRLCTVCGVTFQGSAVQRFKDILFVVDPDVDNIRAFRQALELASNNQAHLTVLSVIRDPGKLGDRIHDALLERRRDMFAELEAIATSYRVDINKKIVTGRQSLSIISEVIANGHDLVIKALCPRGSRLFIGSDMKLLRKCPCPVWLIQSAKQDAYREVLVAVDWDPDNPENEAMNRQLLEMAAALALSEFAELHVVHAWELPHEAFCRSPRSGLTQKEVDTMLASERAAHREWLEDIVSRFCRAIGHDTSKYLNPQTHLIHGPPGRVVAETARRIGAEVVVMGTVGRSGIPGLLIGNTAEEILAQIDCAVVAVKPSGFESPVAVAS